MYKGVLFGILPDYEYRNLSEMDSSVFVGKDLVIFDIDNTLSISETSEIPSHVLKWFNSFKQKYKCICSSNSWTIRKRAEAIERKLGCEIFMSRFKKPSGRLFDEICDHYSVSPAKTVVVGDRFFTDILFGNLSGATTVLIKPLDPREYLFIKLFRIFEIFAVSILKLFKGKESPVHKLLKEGYTCFEMHAHTDFSKDAFGDIKKYLKIARRDGIGLAITDHNEIDGAVYAVKNSNGVPIIPGIEVKAFNGIDVLIYFYDVKGLIEYYEKYLFPRKKKDDFVPDITVEEIVDFASRFKCLIAAPHPFEARCCGFGNVIENGVTSPDIMRKIDCIEIINGANTKKRNKKATRWAKELEKRPMGGSDAHISSEIAKVLTCIKLQPGENFLDAIKTRDAKIVEFPHSFVMHAILFIMGQFRLLTFPNGLKRFSHHVHTCISIKNRINIKKNDNPK